MVEHLIWCRFRDGDQALAWPGSLATNYNPAALDAHCRALSFWLKRSCVFDHALPSGFEAGKMNRRSDIKLGWQLDNDSSRGGCTRLKMVGYLSPSSQRGGDKGSRLCRLNPDYIGTCHPWVARGLGTQVSVKPLDQRSDHTSRSNQIRNQDEKGSKEWNENLLNTIPC